MAQSGEPSDPAPENSVPQRGFNPGGSYAFGDIETVSMTNGNLMLKLPLSGLPSGRGSLSASVNLFYNSKVWDVHPITVTHPIICNDGTVNCGPKAITNYWLSSSPEGGWKYGFRYEMQVESRNYQPPSSYNEDYVPCNDYNYIYYFKVFVKFPDGSKHEFRLSGHNEFDGYFPYAPGGYTTNWCPSFTPLTGKMVYYSMDGTYMRLEVDAGNSDAWTLFMSDGTRVVEGSAEQRIYDRNNNYVEIQDITYNSHPATKLVDQLGRSVIVEYGSAPSEDSVHSWGVGGVELISKIKWKTITINKSYYDGSGLVPIRAKYRTVVDQIILPSQSGGLAYTFGYNAGTANPSVGWGELNSVTLPSGAKSTYQYDLDNVNNLYPEVILTNKPTQKVITYQQEYDGTSTPITETWLYSINQDTGIGQITAPDGGVSREYNYATEGLTSAWNSGLVYKSERPDGTVMERIWQRNTPYGHPASFYADNPYIKTEFTSIKNAAGSLTLTAIKDYKYDKNGNVTQVKEFDWVAYSSVPRDASGAPTGIPAGAVPKRVTLNSYYGDTPDSSDTTTDDPDSYHKATSPLFRTATKSTDIGNGSQTFFRTEFFYSNAATTGNLTKQTNWDSKKGAYSNPLTTANSISVTHQYDAYGNRTLTTDARGFQTKLVYGAVNGYTGLYPTESYSAFGTTVQRKSTQAYDFHTGLMTSATDVDNNVTTSTDYDIFGRPILVTAAEGKPEETRTATEYSDATRRIVVRKDLNVAGDGKLVSVQYYDQLGRVRLTRQLEDSATQDAADETDGIKVQTRYRFSGSNLYRLVSNPYRAATSGAASTETTMGWTRSKSDNGGRVIEVRSYSGSGLPAPWGTNATTTGAVTTTYDGANTTVSDQAGKDRQSTTDAFGRLTQVIEDPGTGGLGYASTYAYDVLNNLTSVTQGTQTRTFSYSSLSRLTSTINPESGTTNYVYDANGNLTQKTDARSISTTITYDALNRPTLKNYSDATPDVAYFYDAQALPTGAPSFVRGSSEGRLVAVTTGGTNAGSYYGYDSLGKTLRRIQRTDSINYLVEATYNKAGSFSTEVYPAVPGATDRRTVNYSFDAAGRFSSLTSNATTYATGASLTNVTYAAHGGLASETLGNNLVHALTYNSRLQPTQIKLGTTASPTSVLNLSYNYGTTTNNGNVLDVTNKFGTWTAKQVYAYDSLNRLDGTSETNGSTTTYWSQDEAYDRFGNHWEVNGGVPSLTFNAQNRIVGYSYDAAGNVMNDTAHTYAYDAENRVKTVDGAANTYVYGGEGERAKKYFPLGEQVRFVYGISGQLIMEFDMATGALEKEYLYATGGLLATIEPQNGTKYTTADTLGSPRVITSSSGAVLSRHDYRPFGQELYTGDGGRTAAQFYGVNEGVRQQFTQKERDDETGLDYFGARYYSSPQGQFTSSDPLHSSATIYDPQSWNRYSYVLNNPLRYVDPTGLYEWDASLGGSAIDEELKKRKGGGKIVDRRNEFRKALAVASAAATSDLLIETQQAAVQRGAQSYGAEGDANGVFIATGETEKGSAAQTVSNGDYGFTVGGDGKVTPSITVTFNQKISIDAEAVAHEGNHVADRQDFVAVLVANPLLPPQEWVNRSENVTRYSTELRAYQAGSYVAQAVGESSYNANGIEYWNKGWSAADRETKRQAGIDKILKNQYKLTPASQGTRLIELKP